MPRPRKPTHLHVIQGTLRSRHKDRGREPVVGAPIGDAPAEWPPQGKLIWHEIVNAIPAGVATKADRVIVEVVCRLVIKMRTGEFNAALASRASSVSRIAWHDTIGPQPRDDERGRACKRSRRAVLPKVHGLMTRRRNGPLMNETERRRRFLEREAIFRDALLADVSPMEITDQRLIAYGKRCLAHAQRSGKPALTVVSSDGSCRSRPSKTRLG